MKRLLTIICVMAAMILPMTTSCKTAHKNAGNGLHPDEVFTVTEDDIANETLKINRSLQGQWKYKAPRGRHLLDEDDGCEPERYLQL